MNANNKLAQRGSIIQYNSKLIDASVQMTCWLDYIILNVLSNMRTWNSCNLKLIFSWKVFLELKFPSIYLFLIFLCSSLWKYITVYHATVVIRCMALFLGIAEVFLKYFFISSSISKKWIFLSPLLQEEVRNLASKFDLPNKDRKDSQGICFLGKVLPNDSFFATFLTWYRKHF